MLRIKEDLPKDTEQNLNLSLEQLQDKQMEKFSQIHTENYLDITDKLFALSRQYYYQRLVGQSVLDLGNGGITKDFLFGKQLAAGLSRFVAMDRSENMLKRNGLSDEQVVGDACNIPMKDESVDYVVSNYLPHHFGMQADSLGTQSLESFFKETTRVSKNGLIISEMILPPPLEMLQSIVLRLLRRMPTYVFSRQTLLEAVANCHLQATEIREYRFTDFVKPFKLFPPIIDFPWLKIPAFIVPYRYIYLVVKKPTETANT
jgi:ubiquinone/menaquinone biosynthesis C-methylase UbiE